MIIYVADTKNISRLDSWAEQNAMTIEKIPGKADIKKLALQNTSNISHIKFFVVDLNSTTNTEDEILNAFVGLKMMYPSIRVVTIISEASDILQKLIEHQFYNNIISDNDEIISREFSRCCLGNGLAKEDMQEYLKEEVEEPLKQKEKEKIEKLTVEPADKEIIIVRKRKELTSSVKIGIVGSQSRIGTTHQSLLLAKFLSSVGYNVAYMQNNSSGDIERLEQYYIVTNFEQNGLIQYENIDMFYNINKSKILSLKYDFNVIDYGVLDNQNKDEFLSNDIKLVVAGSKAWELQHYSNVFKAIEEYDDVNLLINFAPLQEQENIKKNMGIYSENTYFPEYIPYCFDDMGNRDIYDKLFKKYFYEDEQALKQKKKILKKERSD